jgi:uncharacterized protein (DUF885 family)
VKKASLVWLTMMAALVLLRAEAGEADWIAESNHDAQLLTEITAKYNPEYAAASGIEGHDGEVIDLKARNSEREEADWTAASAQLKILRAAAGDARVKQDLEILIAAADENAQTVKINRQLMVPYFDLPHALFEGFQTLIHDGVAMARQQQALVRLHRYVGAARDTQPIATLARQRTAEGLSDPRLVAPWSVEIQQDLDNQPRYIQGIRELFKRGGLSGWQADMKTLSRQLDAYAAWVKSDVLPRARAANRLPEAIYADNLKGFGVEEDPRVLMQQALAAFTQTREEMTSIAAVIAAQRGYPSANYADVIRELKRHKIPQDKLLDTYRERLTQIEQIMRQQHLATLPRRAAMIRLASEAESAASPAPHIDMPRLIGNTGQPATFVIPVSNPNSKSAESFDDFSFDAVTWTLTAHEARPGHELQFSRMLEHGVSTARVVFASNSANDEGWALYAEAFMKPYFPLDGQLGVLQGRLLREARAFLDPMLNLGLIEPEAAMRVLRETVCLSEPMAKQEIDRYTFKSPGQATAYFYGYQKLEAIRAKAEIALGPKFDVLSYHDFVLNQGVLPLWLLDKAVMQDYVEGEKH